MQAESDGVNAQAAKAQAEADAAKNRTDAIDAQAATAKAQSDMTANQASSATALSAAKRMPTNPGPCPPHHDLTSRERPLLYCCGGNCFRRLICSDGSGSARYFAVRDSVVSNFFRVAKE
jgi:hypothetical protein